MVECSGIAPASGFIGSMTGYVDCQSQILGSGAWAALAAPGSTLSLVLTGLLTMFIAVIGYNLLLGRSMTMREATLAFVKIGAVFALATSWPAYRTLVYDLVTEGPSQLVAEIGPRAQIVGSDGSLVQRLDLADGALARLAILGRGNAPLNAYAEVPPPPFGGFDAFAVGGSRILFDLTAIAGLGAVRLVAGLMLALGPFFIAFLLFDNTRSLFEGWIRVLGGAALASIGVSVALGLELALLEPWLGDALARRMAGEALPEVATELFVIVCLFAIVVLAALYASARVARAFRLAPVVRTVTRSLELERRAADPRWPVVGSPVVREERSRAAAVADVLMATATRERAAAALVSAGMLRSHERMTAGRTEAGPRGSARVGRSFARRPHSRVSARAGRRDAGE